MKQSDRQGEAPSAADSLSGSADFAAQFRTSFRALWLVAIGVVRDAAWAEDVVQEAAIIGMSKIGEFEPGTSFTAWMGKIVRYVALNQARREKRRRARSLEDPGAEDIAQPPRADESASEVRMLATGQLPTDQQYFDDRLMSALNGVGDTARACLLLRTVAEMEYTEIAVLLDIPAGTAMSHVHRTRQHLRDRLSPVGARPEGAA